MTRIKDNKTKTLVILGEQRQTDSCTFDKGHRLIRSSLFFLVKVTPN